MLTLVSFVPRPRTKREPSSDLRRLVHGLIDDIQVLALNDEDEDLEFLAIIARRLRREGTQHGRV